MKENWQISTVKMHTHKHVMKVMYLYAKITKNTKM